MHVYALVIELHLPGCASLKQKRSRLKPLLTSLHREFNVSAAEIGQNDSHRMSSIACVVVSNDGRHAQRVHAQRVLSKIPSWIESRRPDVQIIDSSITLR
jgi:uncharacterized protein YlxP (DUF503 family)